MSGSTIGGAVGAVIGFWVGGPQGAQWGWMIGSAVGGYVDPEQIRGPRLQDARTQTSRDGVAIPFGWGTFPTAGNIIWQQPDVTEHQNTERQGKGGPEVTTYTYTRSYAIGICEGPIAGLLQIKRNGKIVYDARTDDELIAEYQASGDDLAGALTRLRLVRAAGGKFIFSTEIYLGDETQLPDPTIESYEGVGNVPAYRGLAYIVVTDDDVTDLQGAIPQYEFVVSVCGTTAESENVFSRIFVADGTTASTGLVGSSDGTTWDGASETGLSDYPTAMCSTNGTLIVARNGEGRVSIDGGATWTDCVGVLSQPVASIVPFGEGGSMIFYGAGALASRADVGTSYSTVAVEDRSYFNGAASGDNIVVGSSLGHVIHSSDGGQTFGPAFHIGAGSSANVGHVVATSIGFLAMTADGKFATSPTGASGTWTARTPPVGFLGGGGLASGNGLVIALGATGEVTVSADGGATWGAVTTIPSFGTGSGESNNIAYTESGVFVIVGSQQQIYTTTNGTSFTLRNSSVDPSAFEHVVFNGIPSGFEDLPDAPGFYVGPDGTVYGGSQTTVDPCTPNLSEIVAGLCERDGLTADEYDVSQLTDTVPGFRVANEGDAASAIAALMPAYFFDVGEWDGKVRFIKRGGTSSFALNGDDLVERDGDAFERERVQEAELLRRVTVGYIDPEAAYGPTTQKWERRAGTVQAKGEASSELPLTLTADTAATIAKRRGLTAWGEPEKQKFSLPYRLAKYTPTDILNFTDDDGEVHTIRLMQAEDDSGIRYMESSTNSAEAYGATATGVTPKPPTPPATSLRGPTKAVYMNLPSLRTQDNVPGVTIAACGYLDGWVGASILLSVDGGLSYQEVTQFTQPTTMGRLTADCTSSSEPLSVSMMAGSLASITDAQLALRQNAFAIVTNDVAEIGQFKTATAGGDDAYSLTDTVRGLLGTTAASHATNDAFVMVAGAQFVPLDISLSGKTLYFKAVSFGTSQDSAEAVPFVFNPLFTSITISQITQGGEAITVNGSPIYMVTTNA